jgi:hypothetical protein
MKNQNEKISSCIQQALGAIKNNPSKDYNEVKACLKNALNHLNKLQQKQSQKNKNRTNQFEQWWGNVQSGVANSSFSNMSKEAHVNSLNQLNNLINIEKNKIDEIEKTQFENKTRPDSEHLLTE